MGWLGRKTTTQSSVLLRTGYAPRLLKKSRLMQCNSSQVVLFGVSELYEVHFEVGFCVKVSYRESAKFDLLTMSSP